MLNSVIAVLEAGRSDSKAPNVPQRGLRREGWETRQDTAGTS